MVQFNVFRGILANMCMLQTNNLFACEPNLEDWLRISALPTPSAIAPALYPTELQRRVPHAPFIDLFPSPGIRDTLVLAGDSYDDCELSIDFLGSISRPQNIPPAKDDTDERKGMVVWGDPWLVESWEVEEGFVRK